MHYLLINGSSLFWAWDAASKRMISMGMGGAGKKAVPEEVSRCVKCAEQGKGEEKEEGRMRGEGEALLGSKQLF